MISCISRNFCILNLVAYSEIVAFTCIHEKLKTDHRLRRRPKIKSSLYQRLVSTK